jgi:hypothetical protein
MRTKKFDFDPADTDDNGLVTVAAIAGAGAVAMNGALASGGTATLDYARRVAIISAGDDSGDTLTIVGTDADGLALTEVVTMANAGTAESTGYFKTITSLTASGASAGDVTIGTADEFVSQTIPIDSASDSPCTIAAVVTGTINYTVQETFSSTSLGDLQSIQWIDLDGVSKDGALTDLLGVTASSEGAAHVGARALRFVVNSFTNGAEVQMYVSQPVR